MSARNLTVEKVRHNHLSWKYGITLEQYNLMLSDQGGTCAICGVPPGEKRALAVDHCHKTGRVRALLCASCNVRLGAYESIRDQADAYLARYGAGNPLLGPAFEATEPAAPAM
jgi:hypothetical protein